MNKKTKQVVEDLLILINDMHKHCLAADRRLITPHFDERIKKLKDQGQALLYPPVRFAWETFKDHNYRALRYRANIGGRWYEITQRKQSDGSLKWYATTWTAEYMADSQFITKNSLTLKEAKQACVDFGVANYKAVHA